MKTQSTAKTERQEYVRWAFYHRPASNASNQQKQPPAEYVISYVENSYEKQHRQAKPSKKF
ncbi:MAG TPA: hypothetical protein DCE55_06070 [Planctomycetaceae bacterium]|nr:hypothetical protein [Planctomycetaceae bacterium]